MSLAKKFDSLLERVKKESYSEESSKELNEFLDKHMITTRDLERALNLEKGDLMKEIIYSSDISIDNYEIETGYERDSIDTDYIYESVHESISKYAHKEGALGILIEENGDLSGLPVIVSENGYRYIGEQEINDFVSACVEPISVAASYYSEPYTEYRGECHGAPAYEKMRDVLEGETQVTDIRLLFEIEPTSYGYTDLLPKILFEKESKNKIREYLKARTEAVKNIDSGIDSLDKDVQTMLKDRNIDGLVEDALSAIKASSSENYPFRHMCDNNSYLDYDFICNKSEMKTISYCGVTMPLDTSYLEVICSENGNKPRNIHVRISDVENRYSERTIGEIIKKSYIENINKDKDLRGLA